LNKKIKTILLVFGPLVILGAIIFYLTISYQSIDNHVESINIVLSKPLQSEPPIGYILDSTEAQMNFKTVFPSREINDSILFIDLKKATQLRQFRLYFSPHADTIKIRSIVFQFTNKDRANVNLVKLKGDGVRIVKECKDNLCLIIEKNDGYAYIETSRFYYPSDYPLIGLSALISLLILYGSLIVLIKVTLPSFGPLSLLTISLIVFMFSIFLPQRFYNIALALTIVLHIRNFKLQHFLANRVNFFLFGLYILIVLSFLTISADYNFKAIEKYTLFLVLPIFASCIGNNRVLFFFCVSALVIGAVLLAGASIDMAIFRNLDAISFENFTRTIHPVYYSYLLSFSIFYIQFTSTQRYKLLLQVILLFLLILSGSKLIIFATLILLAFSVKNKIYLIIASIIILCLLFFGPVRDRFASIMNVSDLSIVSEDHIQNPNDPRLNGLTLRLILWQESLATDNIKELLIGRGVSSNASKSLMNKIKNRGLTNHAEYNAHNQYLTTFFETGLIGLILLISMLMYCLYRGIMDKNRVLIVFTILMSFAMMSESILQRVMGITFFCIIMLLLTTHKSNEPTVNQAQN